MVTLYIGAFVKIFFNLLSFLIIVRVLLSWFPRRPHNALFDFIFDVTRPVLNLAKRVIPPIGMIDLSPIVALIALDILQTIILALLNVG